MNANKELLKNKDLYGSDVIFQTLKNRFMFVSLRQNSIPTIGSMTYTTNKMQIEKFAKVQIISYILHRNGNVTIKTIKRGYFTFWN